MREFGIPKPKRPFFGLLESIIAWTSNPLMSCAPARLPDSFLIADFSIDRYSSSRTGIAANDLMVDINSGFSATWPTDKIMPRSIDVVGSPLEFLWCAMASSKVPAAA